ncbi:PLP-dependent lyase/thiolase [bacterium]|mgnify:CR=1 FL=1|nr:PLP-dependent lyase/thiolase [bacterium]
MHEVTGWRCAVCGARTALTERMPWRCPKSTLMDRHHVLQAISAQLEPTDELAASPNPFIRHDRRLAWAAAAAARGMTDSARTSLVSEFDDAVRAVDGVGFVTTPFERSEVLSDELGFGVQGGVWAKDETRSVGGSQKARHLFTVMLHLRALELLGQMSVRPPLAIASCGNAALAAATLARAAEWPIDVYVPTWMNDGFGDRLDALRANVHRCERRSTDPPGDPAMLRFREAVEVGAVPFTVQGPENALCLDGGRTIGWELAEQIPTSGGPGQLDAMFVQVGGGAFAACLGAGLAEMGQDVRLMAVQAAGCAPLDRAWRLGANAASDWNTVMPPWSDPVSLADGILDDETYDWISVIEALRTSDGATVVASERNIERAHALAHRAGFDASPTGSAGLAGLLQVADAEAYPNGLDRRVGVVISGVAR